MNTHYSLIPNPCIQLCKECFKVAYLIEVIQANKNAHPPKKKKVLGSRVEYYLIKTGGFGCQVKQSGTYIRSSPTLYLKVN